MKMQLSALDETSWRLGRSGVENVFCGMEPSLSGLDLFDFLTKNMMKKPQTLQKSLSWPTPWLTFTQRSRGELLGRAYKVGRPCRSIGCGSVNAL